MKLGIPTWWVTGALILLPGCNGGGRVGAWASRTFFQGVDTPCSLRMPESMVRSVTVYDMVSTLAHFDAIWLSDGVRSAYARLYSFKKGKSCEAECALLERQLEENNYFISFYVLSLASVPLAKHDAVWSLFLVIDNCAAIQPVEIKYIQLPPEYRAVFGKEYNSFKVAYHVTFDATDEAGVPLINEHTRIISLYFRSVEKETVLSWYKMGCI